MNRHSDEYNRSMDTLHFTSEQKARIASVAAQTAEQEKKRPVRRRRPSRRTVLLVAAVTAALIVCAGATGILQSVAEIFSPLFGLSSKQTEVMGVMGRTIDVSDTDNGVTITANAIIGDSYTAYILFTIEDAADSSMHEAEQLAYESEKDDSNPSSLDFDKMVFTGACAFDSEKDTVQHLDDGTSLTAMTDYRKFLDDTDPTDGKLQFVAYIDNNAPIEQGSTTVEFENLKISYAGSNATKTLVEGHWSFTFDSHYDDLSMKLDESLSYEQNGMTFTIDAVQLSPLSIRAEYSVDSEVPDIYFNTENEALTYDDVCEYLPYLPELPITVTYTDGTHEEWMLNSIIDEVKFGKTYGHLSLNWNKVIPLRQIRSITIAGKEYSISDDAAPPQTQATAVDNGVTIAPQSLVSDGEKAYMIYTITGSEETSLTNMETLCNEITQDSSPFLRIIEFSQTQGVEGYRIVDNNKQDNTLYLIEDASVEETAPAEPGKSYAISSVFEDLEVWEEETQKASPLIQGHWELNFDITCEGGSSIKMEDQKTFSENGLDFTVQSITVSSISVNVKFDVNSEMPDANDPDLDMQAIARQSPQYLTGVPFLLTKTDGTQIDLNVTGDCYNDWSIQTAGQTSCLKSNTFCVPIPLRDIQSITIGSAVYPVSHE